MSTIEAVATVMSEGLRLLDKYIDDPKRRLKARQEYVDKCKEKAKQVLNAKDAEELDRLLLDFIVTIHEL